MNPIVDTVSGFMQGVVRPILDKWIPDANERLAATQLIETELHAVTMAQIEVNKVEATSPSLFVAGWRPAIGWVCASALGYQMILRPLTQSIIILWYPGYAMVQLEIETLMTLLFGMLGLGAMRSYDKVQGTSK